MPIDIREVPASYWREPSMLELPGCVAYLGPDGSFTQQAAEDYFGTTADYLTLPSIRSIFESVERGQALFGVVPIENNQEGTVLDTIDLLYEKELLIVAETQVAVHFSLVTQAQTLSDITHIYSKDIAFRQCSSFLSENFTSLSIERVAIESTSKAAKLAAKDPKAAALCSPIAAKCFGVPVLFNNVGDSQLNRTRFLILAKEYKNPKGSNDKTTIIAQLPNANSPGVLARFLQEFAAQAINLTKIESRPLRQGASFQYWFLIDFEGHFADSSVQAILKHHSADVRWLGSYRNPDFDRE